jgi:hypothetical protein
MLEEAAILDRDDGLLHHVRDVVGGDDAAVLGASEDGEHGVSVARVDVAVHLAVVACGIELRDLARDGRDEAVGERGGPEQDENQEKGE